MLFNYQLLAIMLLLDATYILIIVGSNPTIYHFSVYKCLLFFFFFRRKEDYQVENLNMPWGLSLHIVF